MVVKFLFLALQKCFLLLSILPHLAGSLQLSSIEYDDAIKATYWSCAVSIPEALIDERALIALSSVVVSFRVEPKVAFHRVDFSLFNKSNRLYKGLVYHKDMLTIDYENSFIIFKHLKKDRTCLLAPPHSSASEPEVYSFVSEESYHLDNIVSFINDQCQTFRKTNGDLTPKGLHQEYILQNLFSVSTASESNFDTKESYQNIHGNTHDSVCMKNSKGLKEDDCKLQVEDIDSISSKDFTDTGSKYQQKMQFCERIPFPTTKEFLHEYLTASKPVVITGATSNWPVFKKWTNQFLIDSYGDIKVHIKITPNGEYEGVEPTNMWENKSKIKIPQDVLEKLPFPDLVVVRPATMEIKFSNFIRLIESISSSKNSNISAYLEYSSITYFPNLESDIAEMSFIEDILQLKHTNIWLSDGNTVGKLHFDPFDNFMCQISGEKEFIIYEPHSNEMLYEAHIQEAMLSYNTSSKSFSRQKLLDSTSMVMSPVDIEKPDLKRFPKFAEVKPMSCTIRPGDVLFTPAFWWHEVRSKPNITEHRNLAINFWYEPFFLKEFPCPECRLYVNPNYFHLL